MIAVNLDDPCVRRLGANLPVKVDLWRRRQRRARSLRVRAGRA